MKRNLIKSARRRTFQNSKQAYDEQIMSDDGTYLPEYYDSQEQYDDVRKANGGLFTPTISKIEYSFDRICQIYESKNFFSEKDKNQKFYALKGLTINFESFLIKNIRKASNCLIDAIDEELKIDMDSEIYAKIDLLKNPLDLFKHQFVQGIAALNKILQKYLESKKDIISLLLDAIFSFFRLFCLYNEKDKIHELMSLIHGIPFNIIYWDQLIKIKRFIVSKCRHQIIYYKEEVKKQEFTDCQRQRMKSIFEHKVSLDYNPFRMMSSVFSLMKSKPKNNSAISQSMFEILHFIIHSGLPVNKQLIQLYKKKSGNECFNKSDEEKEKMNSNALDHLDIEKNVVLKNIFEIELYNLKFSYLYSFLHFYLDHYLSKSRKRRKKIIDNSMNSKLPQVTKNSFRIVYREFFDQENTQNDQLSRSFLNFVYTDECHFGHESILKKMKTIHLQENKDKFLIETYTKKGKYDFLSLHLYLVNNHVNFLKGIETGGFDFVKIEDISSENICFNYILNKLLKSKANPLIALLQAKTFSKSVCYQSDQKAYKIMLYKIILICFGLILSIRKNKCYNKLFQNLNFNVKSNIFKGIILLFKKNTIQ